MKKLILSFSLLIISLSIFSQIGFYYKQQTRPLPQMKGGGIIILPSHKGGFGFYSEVTSGTKEEGNHMTNQVNSGVYRIGTWGNRATGREEYWKYEDNTGFNIGWIFYKIGNSEFYPYIGIGLTSIEKKEEWYAEAEDISSGYNVLGTYWVITDLNGYFNTEVNICFGSYYNLKKWLLGLGYFKTAKEKPGIEFSIGRLIF